MNNEELKFTDSDSTDKAILGTLEGPCADFIDSTRNGRKYSESLWEKVFEDPIVTELIENGGIPGELDHPTDREETDSSRIAVLLKEKPKKRDGKLWAKFSILNTPLGKIAYTLAKSGFKLGISSRGSGDTFVNSDGIEEVDESTYDFKAFDVVLIPAVKAARLNLVTESLHKQIPLQESFNKILSESTIEEQKIIKETISKLHLNEEDEFEENDFSVSDEEIDSFIDSMKNESLKEDFNDEDFDRFDPLDDDIESSDENSTEDIVLNKEDDTQRDAVHHREDNEDEEVGYTDSDIISELQETYNQKQKLENKVLLLQEKLSVCYTKEAKIEAEILKNRKELVEMQQYVSINKQLNEKILTLKKQVESVNNQLTRKNQSTNKLSEKLDKVNKDRDQLVERLNSVNENNNSLLEKYNNTVDKLNSLTKDYNDRSQKLIEDYDSQISKLNNKIEKLNEDLSSNKSNYLSKIDKANNLVEKYKKIANRAVDKYINSQAIKLGVSENEIKNRLPESYSFSDIDQICEDLSQYKLNISKLPFRTSNLTESNVKIKAKSSKNEAILPRSDFDDDIDRDLLRLAGLD